MNVEELKNVLSIVPDEFEVALSINEEGDVLNHIFIDNDCGNVELSNFKDDVTIDEPHFLDMFDNTIKVKSHVLFIEKFNRLSIGTITEIGDCPEEYVDSGTCWKVVITDNDGKLHAFFVYKEQKCNKIIKYDW